MLANTLRRAFVPLLAVALVAAACGGNQDAATDDAARAIELTPRDSLAVMNDAAAPRSTGASIAAGTAFAVTNGARIPAGATVTLRVTESAISKNSKDNWKLAFDVVSVRVSGATLDVAGDVTKVETIEAVRSQSTGQQVGKVATGAAVGAAAGGAVAAGTTDYGGCLPANGSITIRLSSALAIRN